MSTSLDPFLNLIKNIEELENEWRKNVPFVDHTLILPVSICLDSVMINKFYYFYFLL